MGYQLELRHMRYFLAVAQELHFRKAAERLYISQPGLSRQIKEMEDGIGVRLFERHNRKVALTQAGEYLQEALSGHFKSLERSIQHAKLLNDGLQGRLKIGYVGSAMQQVIPDLLLAFQQKHPKIVVNLAEMDNQKQITGLSANDLDIGFARLYQVPPGLAIFKLLEEAFCLVLPTNHPIHPGNFKDLSQVKSMPFILFDPTHNPAYYAQVMQIFEDSGFTPMVTHNTIHASSIYKLVENNFGVSVVPKSLCMAHLPGVRYIELRHIRQRTVLSAIWHGENRNPVLGDFLRAVKSNTTMGNP